MGLLGCLSGLFSAAHLSNDAAGTRAHPNSHNIASTAEKTGHVAKKALLPKQQSGAVDKGRVVVAELDYTRPSVPAESQKSKEKKFKEAMVECASSLNKGKSLKKVTTHRSSDSKFLYIVIHNEDTDEYYALRTLAKNVLMDVDCDGKEDQNKENILNLVRKYFNSIVKVAALRKTGALKDFNRYSFNEKNKKINILGTSEETGKCLKKLEDEGFSKIIPFDLEADSGQPDYVKKVLKDTSLNSILNREKSIFIQNIKVHTTTGSTETNEHPPNVNKKNIKLTKQRAELTAAQAAVQLTEQAAGNRLKELGRNDD